MRNGTHIAPASARGRAHTSHPLRREEGRTAAQRSNTPSVSLPHFVAPYIPQARKAKISRQYTPYQTTLCAPPQTTSCAPTITSQMHFNRNRAKPLTHPESFSHSSVFLPEIANYNLHFSQSRRPVSSFCVPLRSHAHVSFSLHSALTPTPHFPCILPSRPLCFSLSTQKKRPQTGALSFFMPLLNLPLIKYRQGYI